MPEAALIRSADERVRYELEGVGWLREERLSSQAQAAPSGHPQAMWRFRRRWNRMIAEGPTGRAGEFRTAFGLRRAGTLQWGEQSLEVRRSRLMTTRVELVDGEQVVATIAPKSWGATRAEVTWDAVLDAEPGALLFACWAASRLARDAGPPGVAGI